MDMRKFTKRVAQVAVAAAAEFVISTAFKTKAPSTKRFKVADMIGNLSAGYISELIQPRVEDAIDALFDRREAKRSA